MDRFVRTQPFTPNVSQRSSQTNRADNPIDPARSAEQSSGLGLFRTLLLLILSATSCGLIAFGVTHSGTSTVPIAQMELGMRTTGDDPTMTDAERNAIQDPVPEFWRRLELRMEKPDGGTLDIELLRPLEWVEESNATPGNNVYLDLPELGAQGQAKVLSVGACPPIEQGDGNVVTGRFIHRSAGNLVDLYVEGEHEPIGVTLNHPFWSEDRQAFLTVDQLQTGERLQTRTGLVRVGKKVPRSDETVYNLEIHGQHVYEVAHQGVLVHNTYIKSVDPGDLRLPKEKIDDIYGTTDKLQRQVDAHGYDYDVPTLEGVQDKYGNIRIQNGSTRALRIHAINRKALDEGWKNFTPRKVNIEVTVDGSADFRDLWRVLDFSGSIQLP